MPTTCTVLDYTWLIMLLKQLIDLKQPNDTSAQTKAVSLNPAAACLASVMYAARVPSKAVGLGRSHCWNFWVPRFAGASGINVHIDVEKPWFVRFPSENDLQTVVSTSIFHIYVSVNDGASPPFFGIAMTVIGAHFGSMNWGPLCRGFILHCLHIPPRNMVLAECYTSFQLFIMFPINLRIRRWIWINQYKSCKNPHKTLGLMCIFHSFPTLFIGSPRNWGVAATAAARSCEVLRLSMKQGANMRNGATTRRGWRGWWHYSLSRLYQLPSGKLT